MKLSANLKYPVQIETVRYNEPDSSYYVAAHSHNVFQWYCVIQGEVRYALEDQVFVLKEYDSLLIRPGLIRQPSGTKKKTAYLVITFKSFGLNFPEKLNRIFHLPLEHHQTLHLLVRELTRPGMKNSNDLVHSLFTQMMVVLVRNFAKEGKQKNLNPGKYREIVEQAEYFMKHNLERPIGREDMANAVNLSSIHLGRIFKSVTGRAPGQRLTEIRIEAAQSLLIDTTLPITQVSLLVGFNSFSHFTQLFKRQVGISPSDYRRRNI